MRSLSTRVRLDSYINIHDVAKLDNCQLHAAKRFVKAAGGCSASAAQLEADEIPLRTMRFRQLAPPDGDTSRLREAQLLIRDPNYNGMQVNQFTRLYTPAHFVTLVRIWQGDGLLLAVEGGVSPSRKTLTSDSTISQTAPMSSALKSTAVIETNSVTIGWRRQPDNDARRHQKHRTSASACASSRSRTISLATAPRNS